MLLSFRRPAALTGAIALMLALLGPLAPVRAATVDYSLVLPTAAIELPDPPGTPSLGGAGAHFHRDETGSVPDERTSPWRAQNSVLDQNDAGSVYSALRNATGRTLVSASFDFSGIGSGVFNQVSLVWGSPGSSRAVFNSNSLRLFLGGNLVFSMADSILADESLDHLIALFESFPGRMTSILVTISGLQFDTVEIGADHRAMEFANLSVALVPPTPIPVPAAGLLLLTALGCFAMLRRRKAA